MTQGQGAGPVLIRADRLIDGTGAPPVQDAVLLVAEGRVAGVFQGQAPEGLVPSGAAVFDCRGCTLLPGLIDAHVHLNLPGDGSTLEQAVQEADGVLVATATFAVTRALAAGITTVRDMGAARGTVFQVRRAMELGHGHGARIVAGGQPITITGGHTWYLGGEADGVDGVRRKVREMAKLGADFIKVMASGGGTVGTMSWLPAFRREELAALVDEAHRLGRKAVAHCLCAASIDDAVEAGIDQIEHANFLVDRAGNQQFVPATAEKVARAGVPVTGTLAVGGYMLKALLAKPDRTAPEQALLDRWRRMHDQNMAHFRKLHEAGVRHVAGTDAGWRYTPIEGLPLEMELMQEAGLPAMDVLVAATGRAADVIEIGDCVGTLTPGKLADVIAVPGNPLDSLGRLRDVRLVMQGGAVRVALPPGKAD
jgi:imidazolonepropionase-like amidohydrolase